eukprot:gene6596-biopygen3603
MGANGFDVIGLRKGSSLRYGRLRHVPRVAALILTLWSVARAARCGGTGTVLGWVEARLDAAVWRCDVPRTRGWGDYIDVDCGTAAVGSQPGAARVQSISYNHSAS